MPLVVEAVIQEIEKKRGINHEIRMLAAGHGHRVFETGVVYSGPALTIYNQILPSFATV